MNNFLHNMGDHKVLLQTLTGSIVSVTLVSTSELVTTFIIGAIGAAGAFFMSLFLKWIVSKFTKK